MSGCVSTSMHVPVTPSDAAHSGILKHIRYANRAKLATVNAIGRLTKVLIGVSVKDESLLRKNLAATEELEGPESVQTAYCLLALGDKLEIDDRFEEAQFCYFRAASVYRALGTDHVLLEAIALKSAAEMLKLTGRTARASVLKRKVRKMILDFTEHGIA